MARLRPPPLLRRVSSDEVPPLPYRSADLLALQRLRSELADLASRVCIPERLFDGDRRATAATLRAIDAAHGGGFYPLDEATTLDDAAADEAFRGGEPVVDVQTHLVDPGRFVGERKTALEGFLRMVDPDRWSGPVDAHEIDGAAWASLVFGTSETAIALLTSTPGPADANVLTNPQIAAARDLTERYAGTGRVLTHTIVHPNVAGEVERMPQLADELRPSAWKVYTLYGPPTTAAPAGGWYLDDDVVGLPFLEQVARTGPRIVCAHKGLGGPIPDASVATASPRDIGPAAGAHPDIAFVVYHSGYERDPDGQEGPYEPDGQGVDRLVTSLRTSGIGPGANVYAELGSTWFLMLRRPVEAAHVLGKLLAAVGPERILWGTDSTWYGSPQPLIDAFRAFQIPPSMQERHGYPALTPELKDAILSTNARRLYGIEDVTVAGIDRENAWVPTAALDLRLALSTAAGR